MRWISRNNSHPKSLQLLRVTCTKRSPQTATFSLSMIKIKWTKILQFTISMLQVTSIDIQMLFYHMSIVIFNIILTLENWLKTSFMRFMLTTVLWLICILLKSDQAMLLKRCMCHHIWTKLLQHSSQIFNSITCSMSIITGGESQPGSFLMLKLDSRRL